MLPALLPAIAAILVYAVTLGGGYIYDDVMVVRDDTRLHDPHQWVRYWTTDYFDGGIDNLYRPLVSTSYAVEWWIHGDKPWIFHAINILLHALAAAAVGEFVRRALIGSISNCHAGIAAGLLFAVHPVHVEAVANIVGRAELTCTAAIFIGLILLCKQPLTIWRVAMIVAIGVIGLLSKEQGILQPLLWLFFCLLVCRPRPASVTRFLVLLSSWIWAGYLVWREHILKFEWDRTYMDPTVQPLVRSVGLDRVLMPIVLFGHYIAPLIWPAHLSVDYGADAIGSFAHLTDPFLWLGFAFVAVLIAALVWAGFKRHNFILFCLLGFCVTYGVVGNILAAYRNKFCRTVDLSPLRICHDHCRYWNFQAFPQTAERTFARANHPWLYPQFFSCETLESSGRIVFIGFDCSTQIDPAPFSA